MSLGPVHRSVQERHLSVKNTYLLMHMFTKETIVSKLDRRISSDGENPSW